MPTGKAHKCPCCGGAIEFDSNLQKMKCPYCDTEFDVDAAKDYSDATENDNQQDNMDWESTAGQEWNDDEKENVRVYVCLLYTSSVHQGDAGHRHDCRRFCRGRSREFGCRHEWAYLQTGGYKSSLDLPAKNQKPYIISNERGRLFP